VRRIVPFASPRINSFAALAAHGIAFLRVARDDDELSLLEDLAHQCGHVLFSALTFDREEWLQHPDLEVSRFTGQAHDRRTVYVTLHGVFTEALMSLCLDGCYEQRLLPVAKEHELLGRLTYILVRFQRDLVELGRCPVFTPLGLSLLERLAQVLASVSRRHSQTLRECDVSNQPYTFSYPRFLARNPLRSGRKRRPCSRECSS
jgi:hypothetical protein